MGSDGMRIFDEILLRHPPRIRTGRIILDVSALGLEAHWCRGGNARSRGSNSAESLATRVQPVWLFGPSARELQAREGYFS